MAVQPGLYRIWSEILLTGIVLMRLIYIYMLIKKNSEKGFILHVIRQGTKEMLNRQADMCPRCFLLEFSYSKASSVKSIFKRNMIDILHILDYMYIYFLCM